MSPVSPVPAVPLARLLAMAFRQIIDQLHESLADRGWTDVRPPYGFVLLAARDAPITPRVIVELLGISKQAASKLIEAMEADGYLVRGPDPGDARAKVVSVTRKGTRLLVEVETIYAEIEAAWSEHIGPRRMSTLRDALADGLTAFFGDELPPVRPTW